MSEQVVTSTKAETTPKKESGENGKDTRDLEKILEGEPETPIKEVAPKTPVKESTTPKTPVKEATPKTPSSAAKKSVLQATPPKMAEVSIVIEKIDQKMCENEAKIDIKRSRKRKSRRAADLPKFPLTGYVRFMNQRRESLKSENPSANHLDITKLLADEWTKLAEEQKKPYMDAADKDKERYTIEMKEYRVTHPEEQKKKRRKKKLKPAPKAESTPKVEKVAPPAPLPPATVVNEPRIEKLPLTLPTSGHIQIFTEEFLEHNKQVEAQLKTLRKANTDFEFQNSNLERYIENMKTGIGNLEADNSTMKAKNLILENYLEKLKASLVNVFGSISLPTEKTASVGNIERYLNELSVMNGPASTVNKAKDVIRKLDLHSINI